MFKHLWHAQKAFHSWLMTLLLPILRWLLQTIHATIIENPLEVLHSLLPSTISESIIHGDLRNLITMCYNGSIPGVSVNCSRFDTLRRFGMTSEWSVSDWNFLRYTHMQVSWFLRSYPIKVINLKVSALFIANSHLPRVRLPDVSGSLQAGFDQG